MTVKITPIDAFCAFILTPTLLKSEAAHEVQAKWLAKSCDV